jgi:hypothetical protein
MRRHTNNAIDPAAYALRKFIQSSRVKLNKMPRWEKEFLSSYVNRDEPPSRRAQLEHGRRKQSRRSLPPADASDTASGRGQSQG